MIPGTGEVAGSGRGLRVRDLMEVSPPSVRADDTLAHAARALTQHGVPTLAVCSSAGVLLAEVGHAELSAGLAAGRAADSLVETVARPPVACAEAGAPAEEALLTMLHTGLRRLPVVDGGRLVGTITQTALLLALSEATVDGILAVVSGRGPSSRLDSSDQSS